MASYRQRARSEGLLEYSKHRRKLQWCAFRADAVPVCGCTAASMRVAVAEGSVNMHKHVATRSCGSVCRVGRSNTLSYLVEPHRAECYSRRLHPSPFIVNERLCGSGRQSAHWLVPVRLRGGRASLAKTKVHRSKNGSCFSNSRFASHGSFARLLACKECEPNEPRNTYG